MVEVGNTQAPTFTTVGAFTDLTDKLDELGGDDLIPSFVEAGTADGKTSAVPYYAGSAYVFYRTDLFEKSGLQVPTTMQEFIDAAIKLKQDNASTPNFSGFWLPGQDWRDGQAFIWDAGGDWAEQDGDEWKGTLSSPESIEGLTTVQKLFNEASGAPKDGNEAEPQVPFCAGEIGMMLRPGWVRWSIDNADIGCPDMVPQLGVFPLPGSNGEPAPVLLGGSNIAISAKSQHQELAHNLVKLMLSDDYQTQMAKAGLTPPSSPRSAARHRRVRAGRCGGRVQRQAHSGGSELGGCGGQPRARGPVRRHRQRWRRAATRRRGGREDHRTAQLSIGSERQRPGTVSHWIPSSAATTNTRTERRGMVAMTSPATLPPDTPRRARRRRGSRLPYLLLLPSVVILLLAAGYPLVRQLVMSLQEYGLAQQFGQPAEWVGLDNYVELVTDPYLWAVVARSIVFCLVNAALTMVIGVAVAVLMTQLSNATRLILQVGLLLAWAMPILASLTVWQWLFDTQYGVINWVLSNVFGLEQFAGRSWLINPLSFFFVATVIIVWMSVPFVAFSVYAGLSQVPTDIIEAAQIDGTSGWQRFRAITSR